MKSNKVVLFIFISISLIMLSGCFSNSILEPPQPAESMAVPAATEKVEEAKKEKKITVGLTLQNLSNPFFIAMSKGAIAGAILHGADLITVSADGDLSKQTAQIKDFIDNKVNLILLNAVDSKGIAEAVKQAKAAGIPVIAVDVGADGGVNTVVTSDNYLAGKLAGEYIVKRLKGKGNVFVIDGPPVSAVMDRIAGFEAAIKATSGIKVVAKRNGYGSRVSSESIMETMLQTYTKGEIDAVFATNDPSGVGAKVALEQAGRDKEIFIVGVDGAPDAVKAIKESKSFEATSAQHPFEMIKLAMDEGFKVLKGEKIDSVIHIPVDLITRDNVETYEGW
ncbi:substrate-binding domain-containing protein [Paenibacillus frigoriresistens]|uniref:substrate-binding domain-containing protein n=1 Tax=Paenibacillus alginolyticus TaxID=59839 RepID=UPI0015660C47|nr:substrate-binding domain-containing protein [Paenibacillus frigoriresistens]NRF93787.1 substrate-binding domain-containing protein [Paenibacillus frigoriresistens]